MKNIDQNKLSKIRLGIILALIVAGIIMCIDLGYIFYKTNFFDTYTPSFCNVSELIDCDGVARTPYALSMGVPNALWGLILYLVILMLVFVDKIQEKFKNTIFDVFENPRSYITALGLLSFVISMILAYISIAKIEKICVVCFCTYIVNFAIAITARTKKGFIYDIITTVVDFIKGAKKHFVLFLIVLITFVSTLVYLDKTLVFSPVLKKQRTQKEFYEAKVNKYAIKGNVLGKENAKVVINVYSDYNCPFCRVVNIMLHKAAKQENIIVNEINFPLDVRCNRGIGRTLGGHEASCIYSQYAIAAKKQGKFWGVANVLFDTHPHSYEHLVTELQKAKVQLDYEQLKQDANSPEVIKELLDDIELTKSKNIYATPTIEINGKIYEGAMPWDVLISKIKEAEKEVNSL